MNQNPVDGLPHDIHGLIPYQPTLLDYWPWLLAGALTLLACSLLWRWWSKRKKQPKPVPPVNPWDLIERRILALQPNEPFVGKDREQFFYDLSLALREAIERRTGLRATDMTLSELCSPLARLSPFAHESTDAVLAFLKRADFIKFAEAPASRDEALLDAQNVRQWVMDLRKQAEASAETALATPLATPVQKPQSDDVFTRPASAADLAWPSERAGLGPAHDSQHSDVGQTALNVSTTRVKINSDAGPGST